MNAAPLRVMAATCRVHPNAAATTTCGRCGAYVCEKCMPQGRAICLPCIERFDGTHLDAAISWVGHRVSVLKLGIGIISTLFGVSLCLTFVWFVFGGIVGGLLGAALAAVAIASGRAITALALRLLAPYWIDRAQEKFGLHHEVLVELRMLFAGRA